MLARCDRCQKPFVTSRAGRQACPRCGQPVEVDAGPNSTPVSPAPSHAEASGARGDNRSATAVPTAVGSVASAEVRRASTDDTATATPASPATGGGEEASALDEADTATRRAEPRGADGAEPVSHWDQVGFFPLLWAMLSTPVHALRVTGSLPARHAERFAWACALWGVCGTALYRLLLDVPTGATVTGCAARALTQHQAALAPWRVAAVVFSPVLAWALTRLWANVGTLCAHALGSMASGPRLRTALLLGMAPLCLAALPMVPWSAGMLWSLALTWRALRDVGGLADAHAAGVAGWVLAAWLGMDAVEYVHVLSPCLSAG